MAEPYATLDDLQDRLPQVQLTDVTKPNVTTAQRFIDASQAALDGALTNMGYLVPVDETVSPLGFAQVKEAVCLLAGAKVLYARAAGVGGDQTVASADRMMKQYQGLIDGWNKRNCPEELTDVPRTANRVEKPQHVLADAASAAAGSEFDPRCTMGQVF